jgi:broad specificity phosphatase PhoE
MSTTRFWLVRHALVAENARATLYGTLDVPLCETTLVEQAPMYRALAERLPRPATWLVTPLSRTQRTAEAIFVAGYPRFEPLVEPALIEQALGAWQGRTHVDISDELSLPRHAFWPVGGHEVPPGGESFAHVIKRVGIALERLAATYGEGDIVAVTHGGAIRAAVAHAIGVGPDNALHLSVHNLSLTKLTRHPHAWQVDCVNEEPGY